MTLTMSWLFVSVGLIWLFQKLLMSRVDKEWSEKKGKYPVSSNCLGEIALLMSDMTGRMASC